MKRGLLLLFIFLLIFPFVIAEPQNESYACLENKVKDNCDSLSSEEQIFSLLAIKECRDEIVADALNNECWPSSGCDIKTTAQAILALSKANVNVNKATTWLLSQNTTPPNIDWYLEIESTEATACTVTYDNTPYQITIGTDKKINTGAGTCLRLSESPYTDYWLKVSPTCYDKEFRISCDQSFLTTLLYKKSGVQSTFGVSDKTSSASADGTTTEKIDFACFNQGGSCNYEGSLWAAFTLNSLGESISSYKPYLITMAEDNPQYLPESFLYLLDPSDTNFRTILLSKQQNNQWWVDSGDKYYDTALALLPFQSENPAEKTNSKNWLLEVKDAQGCWQGNIRNTAFILHSIWPKEISVVEDSSALTCEDVSGSCIFDTSCSDIGGSEISASSFSCSGTKICCDASPVSQTCSEIGGVLCDSDEECTVSTTDTFDTAYCCTGYCEDISPSQSECKSYGGNCRDSCLSDEKENSYDCDYVGEVCCEKDPESTSYWWIWVLLILIILMVIGIIFRDKLRHVWFRIKSKFKKKPKPKPTQARTQMRKLIHRGTAPHARRPLPSRRPTPIRKPKSDIDDVLKKLKEIGK